MAKRGRKTDPASVGRPRKYENPDAKGRTGTPVSIRIDPDLRSKINDYCQMFREKHHFEIGITNVIEKALRELFERELKDAGQASGGEKPKPTGT